MKSFCKGVHIMKRKLTALLLTAALGILSFAGCNTVKRVQKEVASDLSSVISEVQSDLKDAKNEMESELDNAKKEIESELDNTKSAVDDALNSKESQNFISSSKANEKNYTMADIKNLTNTSHFAKNTLEHIFDGTINSKGNATGYHYSMVRDSKGSIIAGTESQTDNHGVFTAKVEVSGVKKNGFSSFYPTDWSPQQVVDAINQAYDNALADPDNPQGSLWIGYCGDLEIDMYLDSNKKITTAYPIFEED